ncbi:MAG: MFS transporter [Bifidobacteriaceae bacterium]|nr:MFS transporter [Bifidobacteriaceae bacterium]
MNRSVLTLSSGAFALGAAEFVMMGILPQTAHDMSVSIPTAGSYISSYALGVCVGTLFLIFGRKLSPKTLILLFMTIASVGNLLSAIALNSSLLITARFISGLPHGAFFGAATIAAKSLASKGKEAQSVAVMVTGQTVANMLGVPAGTFLAATISWRWAFALLGIWSFLTFLFVFLWLPRIKPVKDIGLLGQFRFLKEIKPWFVLAAVLLGNTGVFCWWSYVSPWFKQIGQYTDQQVPWMMMLAGAAMVVGGIMGGKVCDLWRKGGAAAIGQLCNTVGLLLIFLIANDKPTVILCTIIISFGAYFIASPQQVLMAEAGKGGGELIGGASVQIAFNIGNALGAIIGGIMLNSHQMDYHYPALGGLPCAIVAVIFLTIFTLKYEK